MMSLSTVRRLAGQADAARLAYKLKHARSETARRAARAHLVARLGKLRGLPQKLGQMLSFSSRDAQASADFAPLLENAEPLPWEVIAAELTSAWHRPWQEVIAEVDPQGLAASLGQVHAAVLHDGRHVAIKVQYPGIQQAVHSDLSLLGWLSLPLGGLSQRGFDLAGYRGAILEDLERELDYHQEAAAQRAFRDASDGATIVVPEVVDEWTRSNVLVSTWESGETWAEVEATWNEDERRALANRLVQWFLKSLLLRGEMHADLHPGNIRFRQGSDGPQIVLYDFGCVYRATHEERLALLRLIHCAVARDEHPWPWFLAMGFDPKYLEPLQAKLPALCQVLFEPFTQPMVYDVRSWKLSERVSDILGDDRWNFRLAGPPSLVFLLRAFHGLKFYLEGLGTPALWGRTWREIWQAESVAALSAMLPCSGPVHADVSLARWLKVRVREQGATKVELTSPACAIDDLPTLLGDDLQRRLETAGHHLDDLVTDVRRRGYAPGPVFELREASKEVLVWLE
jgi:predicted unusual protein kinase regulating ubiquinone biosynthesis (AarF/ABC1/UbiB family)